MVEISDLKFIDLYVEWLKKTPNKVWSRIQKEFIDAIIKQKRSKKVKEILKELYVKNISLKGK